MLRWCLYQQRTFTIFSRRPRRVQRDVQGHRENCLAQANAAEGRLSALCLGIHVTEPTFLNPCANATSNAQARDTHPGKPDREWR